MNLVATHHNCTSPWDYISHHALHTHIPVHHYTNYTAVTIHSLVLIASPHLHLIHSHTFKQHSHCGVFCNEWQVRGESRYTCSFISTRKRSNRQISSSGIEGNVDKAESKSEAEQWVGSGQAADREAGSKRSGEEVNSPGSARKDKLGKTLGNVARGKQDFAVSACESAA